MLLVLFIYFIYLFIFMLLLCKFVSTLNKVLIIIIINYVLDFRPGGPGSIPGVDDNMNTILNLWDHASRGSTTFADSRIVAVGTLTNESHPLVR